MRAASVYYQGMYMVNDFVLPTQVTTKANLSSDSDVNQYLSRIMSRKDVICSEIIFHGQCYKNGDLVVISMDDCDEARVGIILSIMVKEQKPFVACRVFKCVRNWLQYFESQDCVKECSVVDMLTLADYKPLVRRGTFFKFRFVLHHRVSITHY